MTQEHFWNVFIYILDVFEKNFYCSFENRGVTYEGRGVGGGPIHGHFPKAPTHAKYFIGHPHDPVNDLRKLVL